MGYNTVADIAGLSSFV